MEVGESAKDDLSWLHWLGSAGRLGNLNGFSAFLNAMRSGE